MKNSTKKIIAVTSASAILVSLASIVQANESGNIYINNTALENVKIQKSNDTVMLPLRSICENLGFEVNWIDESRTIELVKMPIYITCSPDRDGYTFAKTAPQLLGSAPQLIDDVTYVPMNFVNEILQGEIYEENGNYYISYGDVQDKATISGAVCDMIYEEDKLVQIVIGDKDDVMTQTILNLTEEIANKVKELGIDVGSQISAEVQDLATLSIPPQMIPVSIEIAETIHEEAETEDINGVICELVYEDDKLVQIIIGDKENPLSQTALNLSDELSAQAVEAGVKEGMTITGTASAMKTRSIPAQQPMISITEIK